VSGAAVPAAVRRSPRPDVPVRYLAAGMGAFVLFAAGVPLLAPDLVRTNDDPHVFALTHLAALGWITTTMMGALYQLFPVALGGEVRAPRLARWNFWVYGAGVAGFVPSFFFNWTAGVAIFGALTVGGLAHFASHLLRSFPSVTHWHPMAWYVLSALVWLTAAMGFGLVYALDWRFAWFDVSDSLLAAHVHLAMAGWLSLTLMGVSYRLTAMFSLAHGHDHRLALGNLVLWNLALFGLVLALAIPPLRGLTLAFASVMALSAAMFVSDMALLLRRRRRRALSVEQWHAFFALGCLLLAAGMGVVLAAGRHPFGSWLVAYGWVALAGWFGFSIVGKSYRIVPFLTWLHRSSGRVGRQPVSTLKSLLDERFCWLSFALLAAGFLGVLAGLLTARPDVVRLTGSVYLGGAAAYAGNIARLALPLLRPGRARTGEVTA
jgi:hypothetical protein